MGALTSSVADSSALEIKYRVRIRGVEDRALHNDLTSVSDTIELIKRPPISEMQLRRRAERDVPRFLQVLRAHGYYASSVDVRIRTDRKPARIRYVVDQGPRYTFRAIRIHPADELPDAPPAPLPEEVGLTPGAPAVAQRIIQADSRIVQVLGRRGYPFARIADREVRVEHGARAVDVDYTFREGPSAVFGRTTFRGLSSVRERFVRGKIPWQPGDPYDGRLLRLAQRRIANADLFSAVRVIHADELTPEGALPLRVELSERKHRTVGFGAGYASDEGVRGRVSWEHRNLFRKGERLGIVWSVSEIGYASEARFTKPDFRRVDQALKFSLRAALDEPDAFRSRNIVGLVAVDRELRPGLIVGAGTGLKYASIRDAGEKNRFGLVYFPFNMDWDHSDDLLDPRRGGRLSLSMAPYRDFIDSEVAFVKGRMGATRYVQMTRRPELDLAVRLAAGVITGAGRDDVPADERLYAGGGGTIRGYEYQSVGPLDGTTPLGGKSMTLFSVELRWRLNQEFGLVVFADGGGVYADSTPNAGDEVRWGSGAGLRYFTPVGPLRFDLAFPLNRRSGVDDAYQFYISLGQAF